MKSSPPKFGVYGFFIKLVRISGFSSLFSAIAVFLALSGKMRAESTAIARKREEKPRKILTSLMRKWLTRKTGDTSKDYTRKTPTTNKRGLRWAKSCNSHRRSANESYRRDSNHLRSLAVKSPSKTQKLVLIALSFFAPQFGSRDWRSFAQHSFHVELRNGLRELTAFAEHYQLAIGDLAHLNHQKTGTGN